MTNKLNTREEKVTFIIGMFRVHQPTLSIPEQIALLTLWEVSCVNAEEYEMASAIVKEMRGIQSQPMKVPQKVLSQPTNFGVLNQNPLFIMENEDFIFGEKNKKPFYKKIFYWFKHLFKRN